MPDYLLEIGTEELPADHVPEAQERLRALISQALAAANLAFDKIVCLGTPRRLACIVSGLSVVQPNTTKRVKGPPVKSSFDEQGKPLPAAAGFAQKHQLTPERLDREEIGGVTYLVANLTVEGKPAEMVLKELVPRVIGEIAGERLMRWGSHDLKFSRPIRWLVSLLDSQEVSLSIEGLSSGRETFGHRILAPGKLTVGSPATYVEDLRKVYVLVDPVERRQVIEREVLSAADKVSGKPRQLKGALLEEVVNITEWPSAVLGEFASDYLDLPDTLIETVMVHHQRYFPVERQQGSGKGTKKLLPYFVSVANNDRPQAMTTIKRGNERVLKARLADGRFFYFDDQRVKLSARLAALSQLTFHEGLGSYQEKQERLVVAARALAEALGLEARLAVCLERALELCKLDLVTNLVRELPELQGYVGSWYAYADGEPPDVVAAIASHYAPRFTDDDIPADTVGCLASVVDKLDNLVGLFALGKRPSGSSDPYVLRRQAQGLIDILIDGLSQYRVNLTALMGQLLSLLEPKLKPGGEPAKKGVRELGEFLVQRLRAKLLERGFGRELVESVLNAGDPLSNLPDLLVRLESLQEMVRSAGGLDLVRAGVRVGNILTADSPTQLDEELLKEEAEIALWEAFKRDVLSAWEDDGSFRPPASKEEYLRLLCLLSKVGPLVDQLFDRVMINDPDPVKRGNRHALLSKLDRYFRSVADFPRLQPLLP